MASPDRTAAYAVELFEALRRAPYAFHFFHYRIFNGVHIHFFTFHFQLFGSSGSFGQYQPKDYVHQEGAWAKAKAQKIGET